MQYFLVFYHGPIGHPNNQCMQNALRLVSEWIEKILHQLTHDTVNSTSLSVTGSSKITNSGTSASTPSPFSFDEFPPLSGVTATSSSSSNVGNNRSGKQQSNVQINQLNQTNQISTSNQQFDQSGRQSVGFLSSNLSTNHLNSFVDSFSSNSLLDVNSNSAGLDGLSGIFGSRSSQASTFFLT